MEGQTIETKASLTEKDKRIIIRALDKLALALTDHNHQWSNEERKLYERARAILTWISVVCYKVAYLLVLMTS
jgi:hypothetical protein